MRLNDLRVVTSEAFIKSIQENIGRNTLSVAYPTKELDTLISVAKEFIILIAQNDNVKINLEDIKTNSTRLGLWVRSHDLVLLASYVLALHNRGSKLRGACLYILETDMLRPHELQLKNPKLANSYVFDYIWRGILQFVMNPKDLNNQAGPVRALVSESADEGLTALDTYKRLIIQAGFAVEDTDAQLTDQMKKDKYFMASYRGK